MAEKKRLGKPFDEYYAEECAKDSGLHDRVEAIREERRLQSQLRQSRKQAGLTQQQVAERMHTNRSFVARVETQGGNLTIATVERYARAVGKRLKMELA
jgi:HTH-type transcriptional regulator / antitoxin HipB